MAEEKNVQNECIKEHDGNWLVIAGPGTGKTYTITERIKQMIKDNVKPESILCLTFSDTASREMKSRVGDEYNIDVFTFHSFCKKIMDDYKDDFDTDTMKVITDPYKRTLISECISEKEPVKYNNEKGNPYRYIEDILNGIEDIKKNRIKNKEDFDYNIAHNPLWQPRLESLKILADEERANTENKRQEDIDKKLNAINVLETKPSLTADQREKLEKAKKQLRKLQESTLKFSRTTEYNNLQLKIDRMTELWDFYQMYSKKMKELNYIDFSDMINKVLEKFEDNNSSLLETVAQKYKYIIVDEYQDTNKAQNDIVFNLAKCCPNVFVVGDDDQIIYTFQGAHLDTLEKFNEKLSPKIRCFDKNYRSTQPILDVSMKLAELQDTSFNEFMAGKDTDLKSYYESKKSEPSNLRFNMTDDDGNKISKELVSSKKDLPRAKEPVELYRFDKPDDERDYIVEKVIKLKKEIDTFNEEETKKAKTENRKPKLKKLSEIAILTRKNEQLKDFSDYLKANGIRVEITGGRNIFEITPVNLLISYMQALTNPERYKDKLLSFLLGFHIHPVDYEGINNIKTHYTTLIDCIEGYIKQLNEKEKHAVHEQDLLDFVKTFKELQEYIYSEDYKMSVYEIGQKTGIFERYFQDSNVNKLENIKGLRKLIDTADVYFEVNTNQGKSFSMFVDYLSNMMESGAEIRLDKEDEPTDAVQLTTYHSSKGREFDYVIMPNMTKDRLDTLKTDKEIIPVEPKLGETYESVMVQKHQAFFLDTIKLLYVGMTRARHTLILTYSGTAKENDKHSELSWFIKKLVENPKNDKGETVLIDPDVEEFEFNYNRPKCEYDKDEFEEYTKNNIPNEFAITALNHYRNCPKQYFFERILKMPIKSGNKDDMSYGTALHSVFEAAIKKVMTKDENGKRAYLTDEEALEIFNKKLKTLEITNPAGAKKSANEKVFTKNGFYKQFRELVKPDEIKEDAVYTKTPILDGSKTGKHEIYAELTLSCDITEELKNQGIDTGDKKIFLKGFVDRLDKNTDGTYTVYDYKSKENCYDISPGEDYFYQMVFYKYVLEKQYPEITVKNACFMLPIEKNGNNFINVGYKMDEKKRGNEYTCSNYEYSVEQINEAIKNILSGKFDKSEKPNCSNCGYKYICKDRKSL